jgi:small subunit ribosomal protein S2
MAKTIYQEMVDNAVHFGHRTQKWDPRMKRYLYGEKNGIHIFNLEKTAEMLEKALNFIGKSVSEGKVVLFVSTKPQAIYLVENSAKECGMPYVVSRWIPGFITNFPTIKKRIDYLRSLKDQKASGEFEKYTKKEASKLSKTIEKLETSLGGAQNLTRKPDVVFIVDVVKDKIVVEEANRSSIPVVAIVDSNANPEFVDYPIPGNDDSVKSITYLVGKVVEVVKKSRKS